MLLIHPDPQLDETALFVFRNFTPILAKTIVAAVEIFVSSSITPVPCIDGFAVHYSIGFSLKTCIPPASSSFQFSLKLIQ